MNALHLLSVSLIAGYRCLAATIAQLIARRRADHENKRSRCT
ncbi:hypothetical protein [Komarekiella delphini-convector]|nr:hypothetical protein [Komarekiella delphini-convector]